MQTGQSQNSIVLGAGRSQLAEEIQAIKLAGSREVSHFSDVLGVPSRKSLESTHDFEPDGFKVEEPISKNYKQTNK